MTPATLRSCRFLSALAIIPMRQDSEWIDPSVPDDPLTLDIYHSLEPSSFELYEDDGVSTLYQKEQFVTTSFGARRAPNGDITFSLGQSQGEYQGKPVSRTYVVEVNLLGEAPRAITRGGQPMPQQENFANHRWAFDDQQQKVRVKLVQKASDSSTVVIYSGRMH